MSMNILLADDEVEFVETIAERLELRGHRVRTVTDGVSVLVAIKAEMPDVVVLDLFMPGIGGAETLDRIHDEYATLPVIVLSGHETSEIGNVVEQACACLTKPIRLPVLLETIEAAVAQSQCKSGREQ